MSWRDPDRYDSGDAAGTIANLGGWWEQLAGESGQWAAAFLATQRDALTALGGRGDEADDLAAVRGQARRAATALRADWREGPGRALLATSLRLLHDAGEAKRAMGLAPPTQTGRVHQINVSDGGVPKHAVAEAMIGPNGVDGDRQASRKHHGRPWQALCLWSLESIEALAAHGHPIVPGAAGENLTVAGIDWSTVASGTRIQLGEAVAEISAFADACKQNAAWFLGGDISPLDIPAGPRRGRMYASVLRAGAVRTGDPVVVEPRAGR